MKKIEVKGHSGCHIDVVSEGENIYVYKSTNDPQYSKRLILQANKQKAAEKLEHRHIRVPKIFDIITDKGPQTASEQTTIKMQYIYSKNFIEFFEQAGFEQGKYLTDALIQFVEEEISQSKLETISTKVFLDKFEEIQEKCTKNNFLQHTSNTPHLSFQEERILNILKCSKKIFENMGDCLNESNSSERFITLPIGTCHGDLTLSNILFNGNNFYIIDFLDCFIESPLQDIVKIRQDTAFYWSQLMYEKKYDAVRLHIILDKIDHEINAYFSNKYQWYQDYYEIMQLMNVLRILPYAHEDKVVDFLTETLSKIIDSIENHEKKDCQKNVNDLSTLQTRTIQQQSPTNYSLIIPVAADKIEYSNGLPYVFGLDKDGVTICIKSIMGLELEKFSNIYFTILKKHDERFFIAESLKLQFKRLGINNAKVVILNNPTQDQAETVYKTIEQEHITGSILIKDADCYFKAFFNDSNSIAIYPIEELNTLAPRDKSYVAVDDTYYITNIIEKSVVGHYINAGGYAIKDAQEFIEYYRRLRHYGKLYLSHIVYAMLLDKKTFRPTIVEEYKDWGTRNDLTRNSD